MKNQSGFYWSKRQWVAVASARAICKPAPRYSQITTPVPHHSVFYRLDALPAAQPTASKHSASTSSEIPWVHRAVQSRPMQHTAVGSRCRQSVPRRGWVANSLQPLHRSTSSGLHRRIPSLSRSAAQHIVSYQLLTRTIHHTMMFIINLGFCQ